MKDDDLTKGLSNSWCGNRDDNEDDFNECECPNEEQYDVYEAGFWAGAAFVAMMMLSAYWLIG